MIVSEALESMTAGNPKLHKEVQDKSRRSLLVRYLISLRAESGLSLEEVARRIGCSVDRVSQIEHGFDDEFPYSELEAYWDAVTE